MQLKQEANTEHRKKYHLASRLRKAAQLVDLFQKLTDEVRDMVAAGVQKRIVLGKWWALRDGWYTNLFLNLAR